MLHFRGSMLWKSLSQLSSHAGKGSQGLFQMRQGWLYMALLSHDSSGMPVENWIYTKSVSLKRAGQEILNILDILSVSLKNWLQQKKLENWKCCMWELSFFHLSLIVSAHLPRGNSRKGRKKREQLLVGILGTVATLMVDFKSLLSFAFSPTVQQFKTYY